MIDIYSATKQKHRIKAWVNDPSEIENTAFEQLLHLANLPDFLSGHIAVMPDVHAGMGMPIGTVVALDGFISPNMVGVDIGCGMLCEEIFLPDVPSTEQLREATDEIKKRIPVGFDWHEKADNLPDPDILGPIVRQELGAASRQLGTLGGGNHFIEIQVSDDLSRYYYMIHSGSRNVGKKVAEYYEDLARRYTEAFFPEIQKSWQLDVFAVDSPQGEAYLEEMDWALKFAFANRMKMANAVRDSLMKVFGAGFSVSGQVRNIHHNYVAKEQDVWVHRKGAVDASYNKPGIIPGSQGSPSYLTTGLGNYSAWNSSSHGAGRTMSRGVAKRTLDLATEQARLSGIVHDLTDVSKLDEAPSAYKDIDGVMERQKDLVKIEVRLLPLAVIKG